MRPGARTHMTPPGAVPARDEAGDDAEVAPRSAAKWLCIAALVAGAGWNAWNVFRWSGRGESPLVPFVAAVVMAAVALVTWRRWPG